MPGQQCPTPAPGSYSLGVIAPRSLPSHDLRSHPLVHDVYSIPTHLGPSDLTSHLEGPQCLALPPSPTYQAEPLFTIKSGRFQKCVGSSFTVVVVSGAPAANHLANPQSSYSVCLAAQLLLLLSGLWLLGWRSLKYFGMKFGNSGL